MDRGGPASPDMTVFDGVVRAFMARHGVRAAQLTIAQNGVNKLQRAYTWAEPGLSHDARL